jgi:hypothetical protein
MAAQSGIALHVKLVRVESSLKKRKKKKKKRGGKKEKH